MVLIHCGGCQHSFQFAHPSARRAIDLMRVIVTCPNCGVTLKAPQDELHMMPLEQVMARQSRPQLRLVDA